MLAHLQSLYVYLIHLEVAPVLLSCACTAAACSRLTSSPCTLLASWLLTGPCSSASKLVWKPPLQCIAGVC